MRRLLTIAAALGAFAACAAQTPVAPTSGETVGAAAGENTGNYNIVQSWELGYRLATVGGNVGEYRSQVNYRNGVRLLGSSLAMHSRDGHGRFFDEAVLTTEGLGNDPYEAARLRISKNRTYEYSLLWRQNDYYNPALTISDGQHLMNTNHRWQDHDIVLFPNARIRPRLGYSRVGQSGPALTTDMLFTIGGDIFPVFRSIRREYNEYRAGADIALGGFRFNFLRRWEYFKEDTSDSLATAESAGGSTLTSFSRGEPNHGYTYSWMGNLRGDLRFLALNAHVTYSGGKRRFVLGENSTGLDRFTSAQNQQIYVTGNANRPLFTGELNVTLFPGSRWTVMNDFSASNLRIDGNNYFQQYDNSTASFTTVAFQFLGIRLLTNATDVRYRFSKRFDMFGGFRYSDRSIRSEDDSAVPPFPYDVLHYEQTNTLKAGVAGFNWFPMQGLRVHLEGELGRNDNPFTPVSERNQHAIRGRVQYRTRSASAGVSYAENYNNNSIAVTSYSSHARNYSSEGSWAVNSKLSLDGSYSKLHLDTAGGINFFAGLVRPQLQTGYASIYISNIHSASVGLRLPVQKFADIYAGWTVTKDNGNGRGSPISAAAVQSGNDVAQVLYGVQTFPLTYQSPYARLSVRINAKLRWNLGYQWYGYHEQFGVLGANENYRAHTGFTSLLWAF